MAVNQRQPVGSCCLTTESSVGDNYDTLTPTTNRIAHTTTNMQQVLRVPTVVLLSPPRSPVGWDACYSGMFSRAHATTARSNSEQSTVLSRRWRLEHSTILRTSSLQGLPSRHGQSQSIIGSADAKRIGIMQPMR
jgi:hypothetical protein